MASNDAKVLPVRVALNSTTAQDRAARFFGSTALPLIMAGRRLGEGQR